MNQSDLIKRVRSLTRDLSNSIFREIDITDWINEGIDRCAQVIPELQGMVYLTATGQTPNLLPQRYHHLLAVYSTSRCFNQDERHYQASNYMNEFETKLEELRLAIEIGDVVILDENNNPVIASDSDTDYVVDNYFEPNNGGGVEVNSDGTLVNE